MVAGVKATRLTRLEPRALSDQIVESLKRVIVTGDLGPGARVLETDLAEQLGVSRGPVREAFRQLEQEGLLISYPHRGTFVASIPEDEIEEVYALRAHLESYAARRVTEERGQEAARVLQGLVDEMRACAASGDLAGLADRDLQFHDTVLELSGYQALHRIWRSMDGLVRARIYAALGLPKHAGLIEYTASSHQPIVDGIRSGSPDLAERSVSEHILEVATLFERVHVAAETPA